MSVKEISVGMFGAGTVGGGAIEIIRRWVIGARGWAAGRALTAASLLQEEGLVCQPWFLPKREEDLRSRRFQET